MKTNKSKKRTLVFLVLITLITGISAIVVGYKLQEDTDVTPEDSAAASRCKISDCNAGKVCEWPKTSFCTCDSQGYNVLESNCECVKCSAQNWYENNTKGGCRPEEVVQADGTPGYCTGEPSYVPVVLGCPANQGWFDCGTSLNRTSNDSSCQRMDIKVKAYVQGCNNSTYIYRYCRKEIQPSNTPIPSNTPTSTPSPSNTPTNTPRPSNTPTNTPVITNTPTSTPVITNTPTSTPTNTPTPTVTPTGTILPSNTPTVTPTVNPSASVTPTNPPGTPSVTITLPPTAIITDEADRLILGMIMIFIGWTIYWFNLENAPKILLAKIKGTSTYKTVYKKTHPNDKEAFYEKLQKKYGEKDD